MRRRRGCLSVVGPLVWVLFFGLLWMAFSAFGNSLPQERCGRPMFTEWHKGVRHPRVLEVVDDCTSVRGFIREIRVYTDGRTQLELELYSPTDRDWLTEANQRRYKGRLLVTLIGLYPWENFPGLPAIEDACNLDVVVSGARVLHRYKTISWGELQPVWRIEPQAGSTGSHCVPRKLATVRGEGSDG